MKTIPELETEIQQIENTIHDLEQNIQDMDQKIADQRSKVQTQEIVVDDIDSIEFLAEMPKTKKLNETEIKELQSKLN